MFTSCTDEVVFFFSGSEEISEAVCVVGSLVLDSEDDAISSGCGMPMTSTVVQNRPSISAGSSNKIPDNKDQRNFSLQRRVKLVKMAVKAAGTLCSICHVRELGDPVSDACSDT